MISEKYSTNLLKTKYVNDSKITDHYAIIPTGQGFENYDKLPELQKNVYKLIVKRFLSIFFPPAEFNKVTATVNIENETFYTSQKVCVNLGYLEILKPQKEANKEEGENSEGLKDLKKWQKLENTKLSIKEA